MVDLDEGVRRVVWCYPGAAQKMFFYLREVLFEEISRDKRIGEVIEALRWNEPAYLTTGGEGTTVRIAWKPAYSESIGLYFNCKTNLIDTFREIFPELEYLGNRAVLLDLDTEVNEPVVQECFHHALTYHLKKRTSTNFHTT